MLTIIDNPRHNQMNSFSLVPFIVYIERLPYWKQEQTQFNALRRAPQPAQRARQPAQRARQPARQPAQQARQPAASCLQQLQSRWSPP